MKKLIIALLACVLGATAAHAQSTKAQINTEITTTLPDNTVGGITPAGLRAVTSDIVNSIMPTAPVFSGNLACFSGTTGLLQDCASAPTPNAITSLTGDITATGPGSVAATLATVNANVGTFGSAAQAVQFTVNAKGLMTAAANVTVTPAVGSITGLGTGVATALGVNVGTAGSPVVNGGALGTPASGVATNLTGTAAGLTAGNVTTNANLTGPVTSVGNATAIGTNQVTRAMEAQGVARSVVGVTGNATANVADIQLSASQFLGTTAANTSLAGVGYGPAATAAAGQIPGTATNDNAAAGDIGEYIELDTLSGSAVSLTTGATSNIGAGISLAAGDWDVTVGAVFTPSSTSTAIACSSSTTSATLITSPNKGGSFNMSLAYPSAVAQVIPCGTRRYSFASTTTVFMVANATFAGTMTAYGTIWGRRRR